MATVEEIFQQMPSKYRTGAADKNTTYYFSIGDHKATLFVTPEGARVESGKAVDNADCVLKTTPKIFVNIVTQGKAPGALDIARGRFKTNDPGALMKLKEWFSF
ncbi:MAG: hypothetical protein AAFV53_02865 [Myxococcota bacterium]